MIQKVKINQQGLEDLTSASVQEQYSYVDALAEMADVLTDDSFINAQIKVNCCSSSALQKVNSRFPNLVIFPEDAVGFEDAIVCETLLASTDVNPSGKKYLTESDCAAANKIPLFSSLNIRTFDEFTLFTGITTLQNSCFKGCTSLESIKLPNTIVTMGEAVFQNCTSLKSLAAPNCTSVGRWAFSSCSALKSVSIPSATYINTEAFRNCSGLANIECDSVETLGILSFAGAGDGNNVISFPNLISLGRQAFRGSKFKKIESLGSTITDLNASVGGTNIQFGENVYLEKVVLPTSLITINDFSFPGCTKLTEVVCPSTIQTIGERAFKDCPLTGMDFNLPNCTVIRRGAFLNCGEFSISRLGAGCVIESSTGGAILAFGYSGLTSINLMGVDTIQEGAFIDCKKLVSLGDTSSVTTLGYVAFRGCSELVGPLSFPSLTTIGKGTFKGCPKLKAVTSLGSITALVGTSASGNGTFQDDYQLDCVVLPSTLTAMGTAEFASCFVLRAVILESTTPPTVTTGTFASISNTVIFYVPDDAVDTYKSADVWSTYATRIKGRSEVPADIKSAYNV